MKFQRRPYGEILLAPLMADLPTEDALQKMVGEDIYKKMVLAEREALYDEVIRTIHQQNLQRALSGELTDDPKAMALYQVVMRSEPLNLYPIGLKKKGFTTFGPTLRRVGDGQWQLGLPAEGRYALLTSIRQVWQLYMAWLAEEAANDNSGENAVVFPVLPCHEKMKKGWVQ